MPTQVLMLAHQALPTVLPPTPDQDARIEAQETDFLRVLRCRWLCVETSKRLKIAKTGSFLTAKKEIGTWVLWPPQRTEFPSSLSEPALEPGEHVTVNLLCDSNLQNYNTANVYCIEPLKMLLIWWSNNAELTKHQIRYMQERMGWRKQVQRCVLSFWGGWVFDRHCGNNKFLFLFICLIKTRYWIVSVLPGQSVKKRVVKGYCVFILMFLLQLEDRSLHIQKQQREQTTALMPPSHAYQPKNKPMTGDCQHVLSLLTL